ncbi:hypothetical protein [Thalassotalea sp. Y01]|uniref:hypothetical protein n=1 Tax=Thalassotalea sp. Y01 TaxID=2729613 RepID=UPI00145E1260|nr:hypothetical protein [Thalassotalea sp. Y01]NMP16894.1 hypothetical protein [Thalassotalea sp. Y01]
MTDNNKPPKMIVKTLLFLIDHNDIPDSVKQEKRNTLVKMFGSVQKAHQYISE